jgi:hypothetical protein
MSAVLALIFQLHKWYLAMENNKKIVRITCQVWHTSLSSTLSDQIEHVDKDYVPSSLIYTASLDQSRLSTLHERREKQCLSLYKSV